MKLLRCRSPQYPALIITLCPFTPSRQLQIPDSGRPPDLHPFTAVQKIPQKCMRPALWKKMTYNHVGILNMDDPIKLLEQIPFSPSVYFFYSKHDGSDMRSPCIKLAIRNSTRLFREGLSRLRLHIPHFYRVGESPALREGC